MTTNTNFADAAEIPMHHATRAKAQKLHDTFVAEYPRLVLRVVTDDNNVVTGWAVDFAPGTDEEQEIYSGEKVPSLALVLDTVSEEGLDPTLPEEEEEPRASGSVVPVKYRDEYRLASSTGRSNGDWLAEQLANDTLDGKANFVLDDFLAVLNANGVDLTGKWARLPETGARGWQGRFRMNGRQVLEKQVVKSGVYLDPQGTRHTPSEEWMADMGAKHAKWLAKEAKREAAATEAVKSTVEG